MPELKTEHRGGGIATTYIVIAGAAVFCSLLTTCEGRGSGKAPDRATRPTVALPSTEERSAVIIRLTELILDSNARGTLPQWTGAGYYDGLFSSDGFTSLFGFGMLHAIGDRALAAKLLNADGKYSFKDIEMVHKLQEYIEIETREVFGASPTAEQRKRAMRWLPNLSHSPTSLVYSAVSLRLTAYLKKSMFDKAMRQFNAGNKEALRRQAPHVFRMIEDTAYAIEGSPDYLEYLGYLGSKYANVDIYTREVKPGPKPRLEQSDFNPYIYEPDTIEIFMQREGINKRILDIIDVHDFGDDELPDSSADRATIIKVYINKAQKALEGRLARRKSSRYDRHL